MSKTLCKKISGSCGSGRCIWYQHQATKPVSLKSRPRHCPKTFVGGIVPYLRSMSESRFLLFRRSRRRRVDIFAASELAAEAHPRKHPKQHSPCNRAALGLPEKGPWRGSSANIPDRWVRRGRNLVKNQRCLEVCEGFTLGRHGVKVPGRTQDCKKTNYIGEEDPRCNACYGELWRAQLT